MKRILTPFALSILFLGAAIFAAVCWHSIDEVHYLKSFFPKQFTVQEAYYAAVIELIKVVIIGLPIVSIIAVVISVWRHLTRSEQ